MLRARPIAFWAALAWMAGLAAIGGCSAGDPRPETGVPVATRLLKSPQVAADGRPPLAFAATPQAFSLGLAVAAGTIDLGPPAAGRPLIVGLDIQNGCDAIRAVTATWFQNVDPPQLRLTLVPQPTSCLPGGSLRKPLTLVEVEADRLPRNRPLQVGYADSPGHIRQRAVITIGGGTGA